MKLHIDIETYSSVDIKTSGLYKYMESPDFEILLIAYAIDNNPVQIIDLASGEKIPDLFVKWLIDPNIEKHAHNAAFERNAFKTVGYDVPIDQWHCSMIKAAYCGLPLSLGDVSKALNLGEKAKDTAGTALINFFSKPIKPTKANGMRQRNFPKHNPEKWGLYKSYCMQDVEAEREISNRLEKYEIPKTERQLYVLDQQINDRGILIDLVMAQNAFNIDSSFAETLNARMRTLTNVDNPNSPAQLKSWLSSAMNEEITTLAKEGLAGMIENADGAVLEVLELRQMLAKSSIKKYTTMLNCACEDRRARGLFQFYGANRSGRWSGRLIQLQNLPQNHLKDLDFVREVVAKGDYELLTLVYSDIPSILSQLIRTAFVPKPLHSFIVADFSAIEARITAWLANEKWRLDVFNSHGKIYEASAAAMFGVPIESVTKGSDLRQKGKIAELALGYQGSTGALVTMGGEKMGLSEAEMKMIVIKWRKANPNIVNLWSEIEEAAISAISSRSLAKTKHLEFKHDGENLMIKLPSGRSLFYKEASLTLNRWGQQSIRYKGIVDANKQWGWVESYGGKLTENVVQAIARDCLAIAMLRMDWGGFSIVMHVHDEVVCEEITVRAKEALEMMLSIMAEPIEWAPGLPLKGDGFITNYYKKD